MHRVARWMKAGSIVAAGLWLVGCGGDLPVKVKLVTDTCATQNPDLDPFAGIFQLRFTVYGDGLDPQVYQVISERGAREAKIPEIPAGQGRNIVVEGLVPNPQLGLPPIVLSRGETGPLDFTTKDGSLDVNVFLRRLDSFSPAAAGASPSTCHTAQTRAGHTATQLSDGRVLIAGGIRVALGQTDYLRTTEIYDPRTGELKPGPTLNVGRAWHTATHIPGTKLTVLVGGQGGAFGSAVGAIRLVEIFDEDMPDKFFTAQLTQARSRHAAAIPTSDGGELIIAGGVDSTGKALLTAETFNPQTRQFTTAPPLSTARGELAAIGLSGGRVLFVGGSDSTGALKTIDLYSTSAAGGYVRAATFVAELAHGVSWPMLAALGEDTVLITGGSDGTSDPAADGAKDFTQILQVTPGTVTAPDELKMGAKRVHGGAVTLADGRVLVVGGANKSTNGARVTLGDAELFYVDSTLPSGGVGVIETNGQMSSGRYLARYTPLLDGTVLVTGGWRYGATNSAEMIDSIEVYQPPYQASATNAYR